MFKLTAFLALSSLLYCASVPVPEVSSQAKSIEYVKTIAQYSNLELPSAFKAVGIESIIWKDKPYIFVNLGNGLIVYDISSPEEPIVVDNKDFSCRNNCAIKPYMDYDYNLLRFDICNDCRYGIASFHNGGLIFDLGESDTPAISICKVFGYAGIGGVVLPASNMIWNINESDITSSLYSVEDCAEYRTKKIPVMAKVGMYPPRMNTRLMYLLDGHSELHAFYRDREVWSLRSPHAFDVDGEWLITAGSKIHLFQLSGSQSPVKKSTIGIASNIASIKGPWPGSDTGYFFAARRGFNYAASGTFSATSGRIKNVNYWWPGSEWNSCDGCRIYGVAFHSAIGGSRYLYVARYGSLQLYRFGDS